MSLGMTLMVGVMLLLLLLLYLAEQVVVENARSGEVPNKRVDVKSASWFRRKLNSLLTDMIVSVLQLCQGCNNLLNFVL